MDYIKTCPYCGTQLLINKLPVEKAANKCPHCKNILLLTDFGETIKKPLVYKCHKCGEISIYENRPPLIKCDKCGEIYYTAPDGTNMIELDLLTRGDNGELPFKKKEDKYIAARNKWRMLSGKTKATIYACAIALLCIAGCAYYFSLPPAIEESQAYAQMTDFWEEFREKNPYIFQTIGLKHFEDNSYLAIISEPTENVSEKDLHAIFKKYNCEFRTFQKKIGYDGWLRDAVVSFNDASERDIVKIAKKLHLLLYGTDYKAAFMDLSIIPEHTSFSEHNLNFQVSEEELRQWLITDNEPLINIEDPTQETTLSECLNNNEEQVFMSKTPGFIVWVMNTGWHDFNNFKIAARRFVVDSDIIFGAIANDSRVAIIARERCIPTYELPPMRQETLHLLASTNEDELAQSYERTSLFAGKQSGGKDFAPIYLSDELWHTEYGNILNITDQMLKSWSENGTIEYTEFNYSKPVNWTFSKGVRTDLGVSELTYNWNTAGVGYEVGDDDYTIYALNRTGSLPVSYIPGETDGISDKDPVYRAEEQAYDFFSELSSPELAKVVQYVSMYQIFRNFNIRCSSYIYDSENVMSVPDELVKQARQTLSAVASFGIEEKRKIAEKYDLEIISETDYQKSKDYYFGFPVNGDYRITKKGKSSDSFWQILSASSFIMDLDSIHDALKYIKADQTFMNCLPKYLLDRNGTDLNYDGNADNIILPSDLIIGSSRKHFDNYEDRIYNVLSALGKRGFEMQKFNFIVGSISVEEKQGIVSKRE